MANPKKLARQLLPAQIIHGAEKSYRKSRGLFWRTRYGFPSRGMRIIGVTGTNGKTTTASYINSMLQAAGLKTAVYTTAFIEINGERQPNRTHMTVSSESAVQSFLSQAKTAGVDWVILEITSHALDQGRGDGIRVEVSVITNLTQEHLDYHGTMEAYATAKARLLGDKYRPQWCILNADDEWFDFFHAKSTGQVLSFGESGIADLQLTAYDLSAHGSSLTARYHDDHIAFTSQLIGKFNAYNALAAYGVGLAIDLPQEVIGKGIASLSSVPGRMEPVSAGQDFNVIVDFAITPDALESAVKALKEITPGKVHVVFGATGDRDKTKRAPMGKTVGKLADYIYLTDDETYTEDPETIRQEVYKGIKQAKAEKRTKVIDDRRKAIQAAFSAAKKGDTVLLTGIGHEDYRNMGGVKEPWDEREVALALINILHPIDKK